MNMPGEWFALAPWLGGLLLTSVATWAACRGWYGRKLAAAAQRLHKSDQGRLFSQQQTQQARKQIVQLRAEIEAIRKKPLDPQAHHQRARKLELALSETERAEDAAHVIGEEAHGFADTQILS